jgi:hypothetical protein
MTDFYTYLHQGWQVGQMDEVCTGCCPGNLPAAVSKAAATRQVPVVSTMDALNRKEQMFDPNELGNIHEDGTHLSPESGELVGRLLQSSGYAYAKK